MTKGESNVCRFCGRKIGIIPYGLYRKSVVDVESVMVVPDANGEVFVRIDGSKLRGREVPYESAEMAEPAYRLHSRVCMKK